MTLKWKKQEPPKHCYPATKLHGVTTQETGLECPYVSDNLAKE